MTRHHQLKCWPEQFAAVRRGDKTFELRWNDRSYTVGDVLELREFDPVKSGFTGEVETREVSHVSGPAEAQFFGLENGYVALGLKAPKATPRQAAPADYNELVAWHAEQGASARVRADNWRRAAALNSLSAVRYGGCAVFADAEAAQHEAAVALVQQLVAAVRRLAAPESPRG